MQSITDHQQREIFEHTQKFVRKAEKLFDRNLPEAAVKFDLLSRSAGLFCRNEHDRWIRYNPYLFAKYYQENLRDTVPHEVAHYVVDIVYRRRNVQPHGKEWQHVMSLFGCPPTRTHDFDLSDIPVRRQSRHRYRCSCREHFLSATRHNRAQRSRQDLYVCKNCRQALKYIV